MKSPHLYRKNAPADRDPAVIERAIQLSEAQEAAGVTPVLTLKHLAVQADVPLGLLERITARATDAYHLHEIRKRDRVSKRVIAAPTAELRRAQRWLLDNVFARIPVSPHAFAYITGRSAPQCARQHVGSSWLLKLDVKDFFHEFDEAQVFGLLRSVQYSPLVSLEISRIVTRHVSTPQTWLPKKYESVSARRPVPDMDPMSVLFDADGETPAHLAHPRGARLGYLPQGSPCSGAISNALSRQLDADLAALATSRGMTFTRYADDITLSSSETFDRDQAEKALHEAAAILRRNRLTPNRRKTKIVTPGRPLVVLGVRVDGDQSRLPRRMRDRIEFHLRGVERFGFAAHSRHAGFDDVLGFGNFLYGLIRYAHDVQPSIAESYFARAEANFAASARDS